MDDEVSKIEEWCRRAATGDHDAVERLIWTYHARLTGFLERKIGVDWGGKIEAADIMQEAMIDVFRDIGTFTYRDEDSFYRWATRIIEHRFIDHVRKLRRKRRDVGRERSVEDRSGSRHQAFLERYLQDSVTASRIVRRQDAVNALMTCIARLPPHYGDVVRRLYLNEEPLSDIASDMKRSEDAVRRMASRAREQLIECLGRASDHLSRPG